MLDWQQLRLLSDEQLGRFDIAKVNLACAAGLPGTESVDLGRSLRTVDEWAEVVRCKTLRNFPRFERRPGEFYNSKPYFRVLVLITTLQCDLGIRYDPAKIPDDVPFDVHDVFMHGITQRKLGTCATMPVLFVAVGRRLGYPLRLVKAKGDRHTHLFARWDELDGPRFNIEATAKGLSCHPDDYYRTGRYQTSATQESRTNLLKSATPREELAEFINERGWCWLDAGKHRQAVDCFAWASALMPGDDLQLRSLESGADPWREKLLRQLPRGFPPVTIDFRSRRYPDSLPVHIEREIIHLETLENLLGDPALERDWWQPLRNGPPRARRLSRITVTYENDMSHVSMSYTSDPRALQSAI